MTNEKSKTGTKLSYSYLLVGGGIGAILALLFAPKTGQEFRADIADTTRKGLDKTKEIPGQLSEKANAVYEDIKTEVGEIYDSAKQKINSAVTTMTEIPENLQNAVQNKVEQISSSIEAGEKEYNLENEVSSHKTTAKAN